MAHKFIGNLGIYKSCASGLLNHFIVEMTLYYEYVGQTVSSKLIKTVHHINYIMHYIRFIIYCIIMCVKQKLSPKMSGLIPLDSRSISSVSII